jgi:hypothetical protein
MPWTISSLTETQTRPGNGFVPPGGYLYAVETAFCRAKLAMAMSSRSLVDMPGFIAAISSRTVRATTRPASRMMRSSAGDLRTMV